MTLEELRRLREANPEAYVSNVKKVRVDNDRPSSPGVWQNGGTRSVELGITIPLGGPGQSDSSDLDG